jgi:hypothetical protein
MKTIVVEFERGGKFTGRLFERDAPQNCKMLWDALPLEGQAGHTIWSGHGVNVRLSLKPVAENLLLAVQDGMFGFFRERSSYDKGPTAPQHSELTFAMGYLVPRNPYIGDTPMYLIGRLEGTFEQFREVGARIQRQGAEKVRITRGAETT